MVKREHILFVLMAGSVQILFSQRSNPFFLEHDTTVEDGEMIADKNINKTCVTCSIVLQHARWHEKMKLQVQALWDHLVPHKKGCYLMIDDDLRQFFCCGPRDAVEHFKRYLHHLDRKIPQVHIEARIVLADKQFEQSFGLQWSGIYNRKASVKRGFQFVGLGSLKDIAQESSVLSNLMDWTFNLFPGSWGQHAATRLPIIFGGKDLHARRLNIVLNAAENRNEIKTILKPSIVTDDKHMAEILEGEVIPIESVVEESVEGRLRNVRTATYKDVGIQLRVRPDVSPDRKTIHLDLFVENSMIEHAGGLSRGKGPSYPTIITTRSKTKVCVKSGQTTMISGLIKSRKQKQGTAVPFLSKIPLLGWLFKGRRKAVNDMQLLIFVTPKIL